LRNRRRPPAEILESPAARERRDEHDPRVRNRSLVIEDNVHAVQSDSHMIMHRECGLLAGQPYRHGGSRVRLDL
jgi:hypothetical protein